MNERPEAESKSAADDFTRQAKDGRVGFFAEFWDFLLHNKKWWITPIMLVILLLGFLMVLGNSVVAPFIYALF